jgi:hypothetical protein
MGNVSTMVYPAPPKGGLIIITKLKNPPGGLGVRNKKIVNLICINICYP